MKLSEVEPLDVNYDLGRSEWSREVGKKLSMEARTERAWMEEYLDMPRARIC